MTTLLDAVGAALVDVPRKYPTNGVPPTTPTYPYLVYSVAGDRAEGYTLDSRHGLRFYRIVLQSFGKTLASALDIDDKAVGDLLDRSLVVTGYDCDPCRLEVASAVVRDPDTAGVVGVTTTLTFAATKE